MAHDRARHFSTLFQHFLGFSPILGIFGHRQVGKTTFSSLHTKGFTTLDLKEELARIKKRPTDFLKSVTTHPFTIDECQLAPELFPALKDWVRLHKRPGQWVLTGSVRFTSRKAIRESLAGRLVLLEMLPLAISELSEKPLPDIAEILIRRKQFDSATLELFSSPLGDRATQQVSRYQQHGGLPGLCFIRDHNTANQLLRSLHDLMLDRDLRLVLQTRLSLETLRALLSIIARQSWKPYSLSEMRRQLGLAPHTQHALLRAFESIFLLRSFPIEPRKGRIYLLEDQFEEFSLSEGGVDQLDQLTGVLYRNIRTQFAYTVGGTPEFFHFLTPDGARVPLCIRLGDHNLGIVCIEGDSPTLRQIRSSNSFLKHYSQGKIIFVTKDVVRTKILDSRRMILPAIRFMV